MEYICGDTNVWLDFEYIDRVELLFKGKYKYVIPYRAIKKEMLTPPELGNKLMEYGVTGIKLTSDELELSGEYQRIYSKLSMIDRYVLAIAKKRKIILMTGDMNLRKAATKERVRVIGSLGILDMLLEDESIDVDAYKECLCLFADYKGNKIRLPEKEINKRLEKCK